MSERLMVWLGNSKKDWDAYAASREQSASKLAAAVLKKVMEERQVRPVFVSGQNHASEKTRRVEVRFKESEIEALDKFCSYEGKTRQSLIAGIVRMYIANEPQYSVSEIASLRQSNGQLSAIGSNLNMIARNLNSGNFSGVENLVDELEKLRKQFAEHSREVLKIINAGRFRCELIEQKS